MNKITFLKKPPLNVLQGMSFFTQHGKVEDKFLEIIPHVLEDNSLDLPVLSTSDEQSQLNA